MHKPSREPVLPQRIGRYDIVRLLGRGGQGIVMLARDPELDRQVAIKLLRHDIDHIEGELASEARIVSRLQHPNIVTLHDVGTYNGSNYLVFEYIDGASLKALIEAKGALPVHKCVILMSQILAGVAYLHENNIIHRDLSPANILISRDGVPKVTDFGLAKLTDSEHRLTQDHARMGTIEYMPPEQFRDAATVTVAADAPEAVHWTAQDTRDYLIAMGGEAELDAAASALSECTPGAGAVEFLGDGLGEELTTALQRFDWHSHVEIVFAEGEGGASWSRSKRTITVREEYVRRFVAQGEAANGK